MEQTNPTQHCTDALCDVGILQLLERDPRPTFVLDTTNVTELTKPVYWNSALAAIHSQRLLNVLLLGMVRPEGVLEAEGPETYSSLLNWIFESCMEASKPTVLYRHIWISMMVKDRWLIISGLSIDTATGTAETFQSSEVTEVLLKNPPRNKMSTFDWTCDPPPTRISPHIAWTRSIHWDNTPLGSMNGWSSQLRSTANLVMQDPRPSVMFWGPELIMIYNEAYIQLLGGFHPCMGVSARVALASVWSQYFEPIIDQNLAGETVEKTNTPVHMVRNGFMEETYFTLKFIPIFDSEGATVGHYEPLVETTREVVAERRAQILLQLSEEIPRARNSDSYWTLATDVLSRNDKDIPFALLYSVDSGDGSDTASSTTRFSENHQEGDLRGSFGLPTGCPAAPDRLDLQQDCGFAPYFRQAMLSRNPITVQFEDGSPAADLVRGIQWQGFGDPCRVAVVCPISPTSSKNNVLGYMVFGLNPRRPYDDDYRQFIMVASRLLSTSLTSIILHEEDIHRRERTIAQAESMKFALKQQLLETQKEVERNALKFQRFAERADIGIFIVDMAGVYSYRNDAWYHILNPGTRDLKLGEAWDALIDDEYVGLGQAKFAALVETKEHQYATS
jgi:PAS domain-containing protein